jgi:4-amino-4-deoxy-L-arabinose transferase-like glycosyltransferase
MTFVNSPRRSLAALIFITLLLRMACAALVEAGNDEAYNYVYTVYPSWSYFDHPPMTMWIDKLGLLATGGTVNLVGLRLGYMLMFAGSTWILFRMTARWYGEWAGFYAALALNLSNFFTVAAGIFALPDGPFLFFTLLTLWALSEALVGSPGRALPWLWVGLAWAGALLTKYHAIFLPMGAFLYILSTKETRRLLLTPGPYLAAVVGMSGFVPVVIWNAEHDWASFVFQGSRALGWHFRPHGPFIVLIGTMAFLLPWIWYAMIRGVIDRLRGPVLMNFDRFLLCCGGVPLFFFLVVSFGRRVLIHWPMMGFVPLFCMVGFRWANLAQSQPARSRRLFTGMGVAILSLALPVVMQARFGLLNLPFKDPCFEFSGWESVGRELQARGLIGQSDTFLFTGNWDDSGHLALAVKNRAPVLCYNNGDARGFAFWSQPDEWVGKNGILISLDDTPWEPQTFTRYFERIEPLAAFPMTRGGNPFRSVRVFRCTHQIEPFPFTYTAPPVMTN